MSLSKRSFLIASLASLAACGFRPLYGPGGPGVGLYGLILVEPPDTRNEFTFVARLEERIGRPQPGYFRMKYTITTESKGVGVTAAQETTRFNLIGKASYEITERGSDIILTSGTVENFTGYSATSLIVSTQSVTRDAHERLMVILADQVVARLLATEPDWRA